VAVSCECSDEPLGSGGKELGWLVDWLDGTYNKLNY
jgi:hypothetical protein